MTARFREDRPATMIYPAVAGAHWQQGDWLFDSQKQPLRPVAELVPPEGLPAPPDEAKATPADEPADEPEVHVIMPPPPEPPPPAAEALVPPPAEPAPEPDPNDPDAPEPDALIPIDQVPWNRLQKLVAELGGKAGSKDQAIAFLREHDITAVQREA